jgi:hypothetical protein
VDLPPQPGLGEPVDQFLATALGRAHRHDPVTRRTGGPAGNARMTAWLGIALLLLFVVECVTLISLHDLIDVHLFVGALLLPLVAAKTATTGWRIARYYAGSEQYVAAGPPPLLLRLLGPLVVLGGLAVLGSGIALVALGPEASFTPLVSIAGFAVSPLTVHQASFIVWLVVTVIHLLARTVPAVQLARGSRPRDTVPGRWLRTAVLVLSFVVAATVGSVVLDLGKDWTHGGFGHDRGHGPRGRPAAVNPLG